MNEIRINRAINDLLAEGCHEDDLAPVREWFRNELARERAEREVPSEDDTRWPLAEPCSIEQHLSRARPFSIKVAESVGLGNEKNELPILSCALAEGRTYTLTEAQRAVIREWFNMIPTPTVEVVQIAVFPPEVAPIRLAREVIIKTTAHRAKGTVENAPRKVVIKHWGRFMSACAQKEAEAHVERELAGLRSRVWSLIDRAKKQQPPVVVASAAGTIAQRWHALLNEHSAELAAQPAQTASAMKREFLKQVLASLGEHELLKLMRDPTFAPVTRDENEYGALMKLLNIQ